MKNPMLHLYIGSGQGKTTSSYGLAIRALGCGFKVTVMNFLKSDQSGELNILKELTKTHELLKVFCFEKERGFYYQLSEDEKKKLKEEIAKSFTFLKQIILNGECDLLVLDEVIDAMNLNLIDLEEFIQVLKQNQSVEIVMTGRNPHQKLIEVSDYVTEMNKIKHPFDRGVSARKGIEY